ncbi:MAG: hypothetical protein R3C53_19060 [Pirellulaceae bacterium]
MKTLPLDETFVAVAKRAIWFEPPEVSLQDTVRFVAYAMAHATFEDMRLIRQQLSDDDLRHVLEHAPPGMIDGRSWAYWHAVQGTYPAPPIPQRTFGA